MPTLNINNRNAGIAEHEINYVVEGKGIPIVFIHGFCEDLSVWDEFIAAFLPPPRTQNENKIIRIDLPGFGGSAPVEGVTIEYIADCVKAVLDHLQVIQCVMIGHSMGGYVSLAFAKKHASYLLGLGMFHSHPYADTEAKKEGRRKSIEFIHKNGHILFVKQLVPKLFAPAFASSNNFLVNKMIHRASSFSAKGIIEGLNAMINRPDNSEVLKKIKCPVMFIIGKEDVLVPFELSIEQTALPNVSYIHVLEKVGHMGMYEARKETQRWIKNFVEFCKNFQNKSSQKPFTVA